MSLTGPAEIVLISEARSSIVEFRFNVLGQITGVEKIPVLTPNKDDFNVKKSAGILGSGYFFNIISAAAAEIK